MSQWKSRQWQYREIQLEQQTVADCDLHRISLDRAPIKRAYKYRTVTKLNENYFYELRIFVAMQSKSLTEKYRRFY